MSETNGNDHEKDTSAHNGGLTLTDEELEANRVEHGWAVPIADAEVVAQYANDDWAANQTTYEYVGGEGDIGPENEAVEKRLFRNDYRNVQGDHMAGYDVKWEVESPDEDAEAVISRTVHKVRNTACLSGLLSMLTSAIV